MRKLVFASALMLAVNAASGGAHADWRTDALNDLKAFKNAPPPAPAQPVRPLSCDDDDQLTGFERNICKAYGPELGPKEVLRQRAKKNPGDCDYFTRVWQRCVDRNGASQCSIEEKRIFESGACQP